MQQCQMMDSINSRAFSNGRNNNYDGGHQSQRGGGDLLEQVKLIQ